MVNCCNSSAGLLNDHIIVDFFLSFFSEVYLVPKIFIKCLRDELQCRKTGKQRLGVKEAP